MLDRWESQPSVIQSDHRGSSRRWPQCPRGPSSTAVRCLPCTLRAPGPPAMVWRGPGLGSCKAPRTPSVRCRSLSSLQEERVAECGEPPCFPGLTSPGRGLHLSHRGSGLSSGFPVFAVRTAAHAVVSGVLLSSCRVPMCEAGWQEPRQRVVGAA